ncbi:aryl-sulfate sulfotransferase [Flavobacteriaceae bacterium KMM 6898]|nr:aryl-sulfate sulfotransferase [Flavobacteriaceae bacterium KMM 6898]
MKTTFFIPKISIGVLLILTSILILSCEKSTNEIIEEETIELTPDPIPEETGEEETAPPIKVEGEITVYDQSAMEDSYILVNNIMGGKVFLIDKTGTIVQNWEMEYGIGNDCTLLDNGKLLALLKDPNAKITFGGYGGIIRILNKDSSVEKEIIYSSDNKIAHHDIEMLPNGNLLVLVWEKITASAALENGFNTERELYPEALIEIDPNTEDIVWSWHSMDHIVQDLDNTKLNFGNIPENFRKIDINYEEREEVKIDGDIMHINGIDYDKENDIIFMSVNNFSEIWAIDHSTTTEEAKSSSGGNFGYGGDLLYRFGNPTTYQNTNGARLFYNMHNPNLTNQNQSMLVYANQNNVSQSEVFEFDLNSLILDFDTNNEPLINWSYTNPDLYSRIVSSAIRQKNGNTLITDSDTGIIEVSPDGTIVWEFKGPGLFWRAYPLSKDEIAIQSLNLN